MRVCVYRRVVVGVSGWGIGEITCGCMCAGGGRGLVCVYVRVHMCVGGELRAGCASCLVCVCVCVCVCRWEGMRVGDAGLRV